MARAAVVAVALALLGPPTHADFEIIAEHVIQTSRDQAFDITNDGDRWYVAQAFWAEWDEFDQDFEYLSTAQASVGDAFRAISFSRTRGTMFAADYATGVMHEFTLEGEEITNFATGAAKQINAIAAHRTEDVIWVGLFNGEVRQYSVDGSLLSAFNTPIMITGLAIDEAAGTLLLLDSSTDAVHEYAFDGSALDVPIPLDFIPDNGLGLFYDATSATLYATTQTGPPRVTVFHDPDRQTLDDAPDCPADCDDNGLINKLDFICFIQAWKARDPDADCNKDGLFNILDFVCFQNAFLTACGESTDVRWKRPSRARGKACGRKTGRAGKRFHRR